MSAAGRDAASADAASDVAAAVREAGFVHLVARAAGDPLAATGVLARALDARGTPYQATVARPYEDAVRGTEADALVAIGTASPAADATIVGPKATSAVAFEAVRELGDAPDPVLALAGTIVAGTGPGPISEAVEAAGVERRPGVGVPVADLADGLAHSTLVHAPFSGDPEAARRALAELDLVDEGEGAEAVSQTVLDDDDRRRVASLVALAVAGDEAATARGAERVERGLRPYVGGPAQTVAGYADLLDACARERPGVAAALAVGHEGVREEALAAWRDHATAAHAAVRSGERTRHDGLTVVRTTEAPVATVARLVADFRAPEPVTLVVGGDAVAIRATDGSDAAEALETALEDVAASSSDAVERIPGVDDRARARLPAETDARAVVDAVRGAL